MPANTDHTVRSLYRFGPFRVDPEKELLLRSNEAVPIAPKAFQILLVLMRHSKQVVTKDDLMKTVWPDAFVEETNLTRNIFLLRKALGESPQDHQYIVTVPGRGYRFAEDVQLVPEQELSIVAASHAKMRIEVIESDHWRWTVGAASVVIAVVVGLVAFFLHRRPILTEKDTVVLTDFANSTGNPVFDGTLRQGLAVELEQSPFLTLISDQRMRQTLRLMDQPADVRLTPQIAQDLCQRTQSAAYLTGSIANLGDQYVLGLKAISCSSGDVLAEEQETASGKERVLAALDQAANKLREKLGESLKTVEKFDTPLEQATTPSLEALQAYTLGRKTQAWKDEFAASVPFYQRAIRFDPNFVIAQAALGVTYWDLGETLVGAEYSRKAYELHAPVSEPERFYVDTAYYQFAIGDHDQARQVYEIWAQIYPRNSSPRIRLAELYGREGKYEEALPQIREAIRLDPSKGVSLRDLIVILIDLNRFQEAHTTAEEAIANGLDSPMVRAQLYKLAFLEGDASTMARQVASVSGKSDGEGQMLELEAKTAAYSGRLRESRDLSRRAEEVATRAAESEVAASFEANAALQEALFGNSTDARLRAGSATEAQMGRRAQYAMAMSSAIAGDTVHAQALADDLARRYPNDTLVNFNCLPTIRAQIALNRRDPPKAIEILQQTGPYELSSDWWGFLGAVYVRGEAYLMARQGAEAAAEFQKILNHRGIVANSPSGALAHLQLGRAYVVFGDKNKAKREYQDFLGLWKDADADIPILIQAKVEYAKLN